MIFVTVGSSSIQFDRLLAAVDELEYDEQLIVQHGASSIRPRGAECVDFLGYDEFVELIGDARAVVTHAGVGSIITAFRSGKQPIVVPRRREFGEAVDNHQVLFAERAESLGLVTVVDDLSSLAKALNQ